MSKRDEELLEREIKWLQGQLIGLQAKLAFAEGERIQAVLQKREDIVKLVEEFDRFETDHDCQLLVSIIRGEA